MMTTCCVTLSTLVSRGLYKGIIPTNRWFQNIQTLRGYGLDIFVCFLKKCMSHYGTARPLTAFAFRVHTHALGREVFLERLVAGRMTATNETDVSDGSAPVRLMGRDPQLPQLFEQLTEPIVIRPVGPGSRGSGSGSKGK